MLQFPSVKCSRELQIGVYGQVLKRELPTGRQCVLKQRCLSNTILNPEPKWTSGCRNKAKDSGNSRKIPVLQGIISWLLQEWSGLLCAVTSLFLISDSRMQVIAPPADLSGLLIVLIWNLPSYFLHMELLHGCYLWSVLGCKTGLGVTLLVFQSFFLSSFVSLLNE